MTQRNSAPESGLEALLGQEIVAGKGLGQPVEDQGLGAMSASVTRLISPLKRTSPSGRSNRGGERPGLGGDPLRLVRAAENSLMA